MVIIAIVSFVLSSIIVFIEEQQFMYGYYDCYRYWLHIKPDNLKKRLFWIGSLILVAASLTLVIYDYIIWFLIPYFLSMVLIFMVLKYPKIRLTRRVLMKATLGLTFLLTIFICLAIFERTLIYIYPFLSWLVIFLPYISLALAFPLERSIQKCYLNEARGKMTKNPKLKVIGITGSYGKTSFKYFLKELMSSKRVLVIPHNINTLMGITKFINENLTPFDDYLIIEIGIDRLKGMKKYKGFLSLDYAIITSIGPQHLATFKTLENVYEAKTDIVALLKPGGKVFHSLDSCPYSQKFDGYQTLGYSSEDYNVSSVEAEYKTISFKNTFLKTKLHFSSSIHNAYGAYLVASSLGVSKSELYRSFMRLKEISRRKEVKRVDNMVIIDDSYNINITSAKESLQELSEYPGLKALITSGLAELGRDSTKYEYEFGKCSAFCNLIVFINREPSRSFLKGYSENGGNLATLKCVKKTDEAFNHARGYDALLLLSLGDKSTLS